MPVPYLSLFCTLVYLDKSMVWCVSRMDEITVTYLILTVYVNQFNSQ